MLLKTLYMIQHMPTFSMSKLANNLNIDIGMAEQLVNQLKTMGYIKEEKINKCCGDCKGCMNSRKGKPIKVLTITEKGNKVLKITA